MNSLLKVLAFLALANSLTAQCPPVLLNCPNVPQMLCDETTNNAQIWNESYWYDPAYELHDLPEGTADLSITVLDACKTGPILFKYRLYLDLDANGSQETIVDSDELPGWNTIYFNNAAADSLTGGTPRNFDERPVLPELKYGFALQTTTNGDTLTARVRWATQQNPANYTQPELPLGATHRIEWTVAQGAETSTCTWEFMLEDCKKPDVFCVNGLNVNIMPTAMVVLWDSDFLNNIVDNIAPANQLITGVRVSGTGTGFPLNPDGTPQKYVVFDCNTLGENLIELWALDKAGNAGYCEAYVVIQDNNSNCQPVGNAPLACVTFHCDGQPMDEVFMDIKGNNPALPPITFFPPYLNQTGVDGCWNPTSLSIPFLADYTLAPSLDNNHLNGVSTFDLILINKHILGTEPLNNPYKYLAADANNSRSVTTFDIIELRKLILGVYQELPNNTSWRFVPKDYVFPSPQNPFQQVIPASVFLSAALQGPIEFLGVKVGDVNCNAVAHSFAAPPDDRAVTALALPDAPLATGQLLETELYFPMETAWQGLQFALEFDPEKIALEEVLPAGLPNLDASNFAQPKPGVLTFSWFDVEARQLPTGTPVLKLRWRAKTALQLSEAVWLAPKQLHPEAYTQSGESQTVQLLFGDPANRTETAIFNPQPNPTGAGARIAVQVSDISSNTTLELFDLNGRRVYQNKLELPEGLHWLDLPAAAMPIAGVYVWRVQAGKTIASGRLVRF
ncbi:MAG: T9SS type A sorting domain-containing protein [Lewinellaceae bacterium]|nr:T9SS type A sorting domain-containing protein [Lewinellaceae bacterium]